MGDTKISWLKSSSRSAISEISPSAADCHTVCASTPLNTNVVRSRPPGAPNPAWSAGPMSTTRINGNESSENSRSRSRSSLTKSRCAIAATAESSANGRRRTRAGSAIPVLRAAHDLEIGVLERWRVRSDPRQGRGDGTQRGMGGARVDVDPERPVARRRKAQARELVAQPRAVVGIDDQPFAGEVRLERGGGPDGDDPAGRDDADPVRLLGLLEVVGGQHDRRAVLPAD